ncbi:MAG: phosphatase PAP2 family protein [Candidatus Berkelbacteria bacterium]|nr:MAG: phosphatase PAP2 family protein [Candidatus Berkelbacteria bacterium]QQG51625.1 MAG: phosphatase PAP2 family protein [Candidatus Berkelbacteria bacterium]
MAPTQAKTEPSTDFKRTLAVWISNASNPVLLVAVSLIYITNRYVDELQEVIGWSITGLTLIVIAPALIYLLVSRQYDKKIDMDITNRADRPLPLMLASLGALVGGVIVSNRLDSPNLLLMSQTLVAMLMVLTVISLVWKISIHASTMAALVTLLVIFRGRDLLPLYLLLIPLAWARLELKQHTIAQLIGGAMLGVAVTYFASALLRN